MHTRTEPTLVGESSGRAPGPLDAFDRMLTTFDEAFARFGESRAMRFLTSRSFTQRHYAAALREFYFYTRDNPQLQASLTLHLRGSQRTAVKRLLAHAIAEVGHDQMALDDLRTLGEDVRSVEYGAPLPSTIPMIAFPVWQLTQGNPIGYLGHVFFLEFMPTRGGSSYLQALESAGIPSAACSFISEHAAVDVQHNQLMRQHVADLVLSEADLDACVQAIRTSAHLYAHMLEGAFASVTGEL